MALDRWGWSELLRIHGSHEHRRTLLQFRLTRILENHRSRKAGEIALEIWKRDLATACMLMAAEYDDVSILQIVLQECYDIPHGSPQADLCSFTILHGHDSETTVRAVVTLIEKGPELPGAGLMDFIRRYISDRFPRTVHYAEAIEVGLGITDRDQEELYYQLILDGVSPWDAREAAQNLLV